MTIRLLLTFVLLLLASSTAHSADIQNTAVEETKTLSVLRDYTQQPTSPPAPAITLWSWPADVKNNALKFSQMQVVETDGKRALRLTVTDQLPWDKIDAYRAFIIGPDLLPPTADAVAFRCRVLDGSITLSVGGPTIYFGHSDVQTQSVTLTAKDTPEWRTVTLSLHDNLTRNFRRAGFGKNAPVIYYTRWIQEPMGVYIHKGSVGTLLIERIDLLTQNRGKPYPTFPPQDIKPIAPIADFANPDSLNQVFAATHEPADFNAPLKPTRPTWKPPLFSHTPKNADGKEGFLTIEHQGAEEIAFTGIKLTPAPAANAIAIDIRASNRLPLVELSVDWVLYASPPASPLNFDHFRPPESWRSDKANAFDYYLTRPASIDQSYAFYHTRRALLNGQWTTVILPLADFVCVFGSGPNSGTSPGPTSMASSLSQQLPIDPATPIALGLLPSFRQHRQPTTFEIKRIQWVHLPTLSARSFPQIDLPKPATPP